ncbi:MAG TPA: ligase-associated DNA damage response endonuclease PdeM [Casimicrobiaceae bacterium]|nr:ligase-associated DNA damage response endonuclease PdeM [Casimicrobiaceae bacterium]
MSQRHIDVVLAGTQVRLLADKALYWPSEQVLFVADAHFGKAAAFRALGQPVPRGTTAANVERLDALLAAHPASHLVFLGDFLHARKSLTSPLRAALLEWRARHPAIRCTLIRGNHDKRAGDPPGELQIDVVEEPFALGPFALCHAPRDDSPGFVIAGHIHPVCRLQGAARQSLRLPCFVVSDRCAVLPSFGAFTGGYEIGIEPGSRVFVTDSDSIWAVRGRGSAAAADS